MTNQREAYERPTIEPVGTLQDLTRSSDAPNSDVQPFKNNSAFGPPS